MIPPDQGRFHCGEINVVDTHGNAAL